MPPSLQVLRATYALLISSLFPDDDPEYYVSTGHRDDTVYINRLVGRIFKIDIKHLDEDMKAWYIMNGFSIVGDNLVLSWDNYRSVCKC